MGDTFSIALTMPELAFLGSALRLPGLNVESEWGIADEEEAMNLLRVAQRELGARDYIRLPDADDGPMAVDQTVAAIVSVLGLPQYGVEMQSFREKRVEPERTRFLGVGELIVEQTSGPADTHTLTACRTRDVALARLLAFLGLKEQPPAHTQSFHITAGDMAQLPYIIAGNGPEDGAAFLREKGAPPGAATHLAAALDNPVRQSVIRAAVWRDGEPREVGRLTLLEEIYGLWLFAPTVEDGDMLAVTPLDAAEAADRIRDLTFQVMPPEPIQA